MDKVKYIGEHLWAGQLGHLLIILAFISSLFTAISYYMAARSKSNLRSYLDTHWKNLNSYMKSGKVARSQWLESCKSI